MIYRQIKKQLSNYQDLLAVVCFFTEFPIEINSTQQNKRLVLQAEECKVSFVKKWCEKLTFAPTRRVKMSIYWYSCSTNW